jgi:hypothetical protein
MKTFPRFNDAIILQSITQPQAKVILVALNAFARSLDNQASTNDLKSLMAHCQASYDFSFPASYSENPKLLEPQVHQLIDTICNAYCEERDYQVNLAAEQFTQYAHDNFDPDVFNLAPGQTLRLANHD